MNKKIWPPPGLGAILGLLAGITSVTGLSFFITDSTNNTHTIGFFVTLFLLSAALGGPLAGAIAPSIWVTISALYGPADMKAVITVPAIFWSNIFALGTTAALVGFAYRFIYERVKMPARLLAWAGIVIAFYVVALPASLTPQYLLLGNPPFEILPAVRSAYSTYLPQAIFDVFLTSLVFIALPARYRRPLWYDVRAFPPPADERALAKETHS